MAASSPAERERRIIVRPGVDPRFARAALDWNTTGPGLFTTGVVLGIAVSMGAFVIPGIGPILGSIGLAASLGVGAYPAVRYRNDVVGPPRWRFGNIPITGEALAMLRDIYDRFDYARRMVDEVPTGIEWAEVDGDVRTLLWEAAGVAAKVAGLDDEIVQMRYATPGTPQAAFLARLTTERTAQWDQLVDIQWEAETLARQAGNAVAAARLAVSRTGSLDLLRLAVPSREALRAKGALAVARARLALLAEVWASLDETGAIADESVRRQLEPPRDQA